MEKYELQSTFEKHQNKRAETVLHLGICVAGKKD